MSSQSQPPPRPQTHSGTRGASRGMTQEQRTRTRERGPGKGRRRERGKSSTFERSPPVLPSERVSCYICGHLTEDFIDMQAHFYVKHPNDRLHPVKCEVKKLQRPYQPKKIFAALRHPLSNALDNLSPFDERRWKSTYSDFGFFNPSGPPLSRFFLNTAKYYLPDHPHWKDRPPSSHQGMRSTYMDLGQQISDEYFQHNFTQEYVYQ